LLSAVRAILFDAGGVLVRLDYETMAAEATALGEPLTATELARAEGVARRRLDRAAHAKGRVPGTDTSRRRSYFAELLDAAGVAPERADGLLAALREIDRERSLWRVPVEGAAETLGALRARGYPVAVVSNSDGRVEGLLRQVGLRDLVSFVLDSHLEGIEKPDPEIFHRATRRLGVSGIEVAYVGDIYSIDVLGARAAGLVPVLLDAVDSYADADCLRLRRLPELLDRLAGEG
jgi:putative hydrolase of the HAD superfamily